MRRSAGASRREALGKLARALRTYQVVGLPTNIAFLERVATHRAFVAAELDTGFISVRRASAARLRLPVLALACSRPHHACAPRAALL